MERCKAKIEEYKGFKYILAENFKICLIDGRTRKEISLIYPKRSDGAYYLDKFCKYLREYHSINMFEFLEKLKTNTPFKSQHRAGYYALDFAFPDKKIAIECQGQYYHSDPRFYPDGPKTTMQKKNSKRDKQKKGYLKKNGWYLIELWEKEINNGEFEEVLLCNLQKLKVLEA